MLEQLSWEYGVDTTNSVTVFVLGFLWFDYVFTTASQALNLKALSPHIPKEFVDILDAKEYKQSQVYTKAKTYFKLVQETWGLLEFHVMWYVGYYNAVDVYIRENMAPIDGYEEISYGCYFMVVSMVVSTVLGQPFSLYNTFVLEERFGFNKTTLWTYVMDAVKSFALSIIIGLPMFSVIMYLLQVMGTSAWLYCWGTISAFTLLMQFLAPVVILPLFYKMTLLQDGELKSCLAEYADKQNFKFSGVYVIDGSTRSSHSNAFFTGFGKSKRICIYDTLVEKSTTPEILAILGHEIGHYQRNHIMWTTAATMLQTGFMLFFMQQTLDLDVVYTAFKIQTPSVYMGLILFSGLYAPVSFVTGIAMKMYSRRNEFEADEYSVETVGNSEALVSGLKSLSKNSQSNLTPHPLYVFVNYSHPPMIERINHIREYAKQLSKKSG